MDATYKVALDDINLFVGAVITNAGYQPIFLFITDKEDTESIKEPLIWLRQHIIGEIPRFWLTDNCKAQLNAINQIFPGNISNDI